MNFMTLFFMGKILMDKAGGEGGGGGGTTTTTTTPDPKDTELAALKAELEKLKAKPADPKPDPDLADKAKLEAEAKIKLKANQTSLEKALKFDMTLPEFLKQNASILPKDAADIVSQANKESYDDAIAKDRAVKSALMKSFFQVQANQDQLTAYQKQNVADWMLLTNTAREEKAAELYEQIFEPAFETIKKIKKAEALTKGHAPGDDDAYTKRMIEISRKHYLGENKNAT